MRRRVRVDTEWIGGCVCVRREGCAFAWRKRNECLHVTST